ncbi:MAG: HAMP domain-containing histidine kinase [Ruminococcus sp.]|nr:HAMP domain-containing histidine kinase [Ruminococcus sp.]
MRSKMKMVDPMKRTTLKSLLLRALIAVTVLTVVFAFVYKEYLRHTITNQCSDEIGMKINMIQKDINELEAENGQKNILKTVSAELAIYSSFDINFDQPFGDSLHFVSQRSPNCHYCAVLLDENNNIVSSNRQILTANMKFGNNDSDNGIYLCDNEALQMEQVDKLYYEYRQRLQKDGENYYGETHFTSVYVDRETHTFIPHEGVITYYRLDKNGAVDQTDITEEYPVQINIDDKKYELISLEHDACPRCFYSGFYGESRSVLEEFEREQPFEYVAPRTSYGLGGNSSLQDGRSVFSESTRIYIDGKPYWLILRFMFNFNDPQLTALYWKWVVIFAVLLTVAALLWCWHRNVMNKAKYAFEDYQRDLTDHLAHDIKTPLMAISGYAENVLNCKLSEDERKKYLSSILDNVAYADSLVSRTLYLNHMRSKKAPDTKPVPLEELVREAFSRYDILLDQKQITFSIDGSAEPTADRTALEAITENLISNAVKYTPENGAITVTLDKKRLTVTNSVSEKLDTKDLLRPFVRGDSARSNTSGNGLGLSIAERAAQANGMKLTVSCSEKEFRTELKY